MAAQTLWTLPVWCELSPDRPVLRRERCSVLPPGWVESQQIIKLPEIELVQDVAGRRAGSQVWQMRQLQKFDPKIKTG